MSNTTDYQNVTFGQNFQPIPVPYEPYAQYSHPVQNAPYAQYSHPVQNVPYAQYPHPVQNVPYAQYPHYTSSGQGASLPISGEEKRKKVISNNANKLNQFINDEILSDIQKNKDKEIKRTKVLKTALASLSEDNSVIRNMTMVSIDSLQEMKDTSSISGGGMKLYYELKGYTNDMAQQDSELILDYLVEKLKHSFYDAAQVIQEAMKGPSFAHGSLFEDYPDTTIYNQAF